jgi:hypothetical protein
MSQLANVEWKPFGISPSLLGVVCILIGLALLVHAAKRGLHTRPKELPEASVNIGAVLFRRRLALKSRPPFVSLEPFSGPSQYWGVVDKESYWGVAFIVAGIGALLAG